VRDFVKKFRPHNRKSGDNNRNKKSAVFYGTALLIHRLTLEVKRAACANRIIVIVEHLPELPIADFHAPARIGVAHCR
jgi:hypothetical protein